MIAVIDWGAGLLALAQFAGLIVLVLLAAFGGSALFGALAEYLAARHDARERNREPVTWRHRR